MTQKKVLYNYRPYLKTKKAIYYESGNDYIKDLKTGFYGWSRKEIEVEVIGEDDTCYITKIKEFRNCDTWEDDYGKIVLLPLGFHKSRLIKWISYKGEQLFLFE